MFTYTTISILFYGLKDTVGTVIDLSFELVNVLPGKFPETRDSIQNEHLFGTIISSLVRNPPEGIVITDSERVACVLAKIHHRGAQYSLVCSFIFPCTLSVTFPIILAKNYSCPLIRKSELHLVFHQHKICRGQENTL